MNFGIRITHALASVAAVAALVFATSANAVEVAGVKLEESARVANQELKLNGAGIRHKAIFKVYVAGLYLSEKKTIAADVLAAPGAKRVTIVMLRDVSNEEFGRGFMSGIQQNGDRAEKGKIASQLLKLGELFASIPELKKGDQLMLDWIPASGTLIQVNGKKVSEPLPDVAFYNALLKIWIGEKPVDTKLRQLMLGEKGDDAPRSNPY